MSQEKIDRKCKKLAFLLNKPAESFVDLVKSNPYKKCWMLSKIASETENIPLSVSVVVEKIEESPSIVIESKVTEVKIPEVEKVEQKVVETKLV